MNNLSFKELRQSIVAVFQDKGYQAACIGRYNNSWDNLQKYMLTHNYKKFTKKIGEQYLKYIFDGICYKELSSRQKEVYRHISVLINMVELGAILRSAVDKKEYKFPGRTGEQFIIFIDEQRKIKQPGSIYRYMRPLQKLYKYLVKRKRLVCEIDITLMIEFINEVSLSYTPSNMRNAVQTMRLFCIYLCENNIIADNRREVWMSVLKTPITSKAKIPSVYTKEEVERIISLPDRSSAIGKRDYAMVLLAARYGLRVSDIIGLRFSSLDWENNLIKINQFKTNRLLSLPMSEEVGCALIEYIKYARPNIDLSYVFISTKAPYRALSSNVLSINISKWIYRAGINCSNRHRGAHSLRHSLASNLLNANESLPVISEILGHTNTQTTTAYLRVSYEQLRQCALDVPFVHSTFYDNLYETDK